MVVCVDDAWEGREGRCVSLGACVGRICLMCIQVMRVSSVRRVGVDEGRVGGWSGRSRCLEDSETEGSGGIDADMIPLCLERLVRHR